MVSILGLLHLGTIPPSNTSPCVLADLLTACFSIIPQQNGWATFVVQKGRAHLVPIEIGHLNDEVAEVRKGLRQGDRVILHPGDMIKEGRKVVERQLS